MPIDHFERLNHLLQTGPLELLFLAEESLSLIEACGENQQFLKENNFGELFGTVQNLAINQFVLSITKLYEKPGRYKKVSLLSVLAYLDTNAALLPVKEPGLLGRGLGHLKVGIETFARAKSDIAKTKLLVGTVQNALGDLTENRPLRALKALRDKKIAHPEDIALEAIEKTTWQEAEKLLEIPRVAARIIDDAYLGSGVAFDENDYTLRGLDGSRVGRSMRRLIAAASKGAAHDDL